VRRFGTEHLFLRGPRMTPRNTVRPAVPQRTEARNPER
jgi:hypothetical protein